MRQLLISASATAAFAMFAVPVSAQDVTVPVPPGGTVLDISAEGSVTRTPDIATIRAGVVTQASDAAGALSANSQRMDAVLAALKKAGIADRDIQTAAISLDPQYDYKDNQPPVITGYQATNTVTVKFHDVKQSGSILDALVRQGANQIQGPDLSVEDEDTAKDAARRDAIAKARARAELYAKAAGLTVDHILTISEGSSGDVSPRPVFMAQRMSAKAPTKIVPGEQDINVTVNVRFLLK